MELTTVAHTLASETRVRLLRILSENPSTSAEAFNQYAQMYDSPKRRESIYRELENLADAGLVTKQYESEEKKLVYSSGGDVVCLDVIQNSVTFCDSEH